MKHTDKSVRDHPQNASIKNGVITITMRVGREMRGQYSFPLSKWNLAKNHTTFNESWNRKELIKSYTQGLDDADGGDCQADRIRDSQIIAINTALTS